jgi:transcriptional regulator with PAS, ATPase and Fis domain
MNLDETKDLHKKLKLYEAAMNILSSGVLITDPEGYVLFFSEAYGKFLNMDPREKIGKHCTEVIENTRMHIVARTQQPEINHPHAIKGRNMIVQRLPIHIDGKLEAVIGQVMFEDIKDVHMLAKKLRHLESKVEIYEKELETLRSSKYTFDNVIGTSAEIVQLKAFALKAAKKNAPILLVGESGTGKELFAHAIHHNSPRRPFPFVRVNCAAIPKDLLEAELFGYEPGAFTGAGTKAKPGKFQLAHRGTIFLDEISELPTEMQPKLLRVLEEKEVERLGGTRTIQCDFRLIAATHEHLEDCVERGKFRRDLYYRLNVVPIQIPPLRERKQDIPVLAEHLVLTHGMDFGTNINKIAPEVIKAFLEYDWPGNIRELSNIIERSLYSTETGEDTLRLEHLPLFFINLIRDPYKKAKTSLKEFKEFSEKEFLLFALNKSNYNVQKASEILGIHRTALYRKLKHFNLPRPAL